MKRILIVTQYFYPETFRVNTLAKELARRGHAVMVLTGYPQYPQGEIYPGYGFRIPYETQWNGVRIQRIKMRPRGRSIIGLGLNCLTFVTEGYKWVRKCKEKFDAVYVFGVSPVTVGLPAIRYKKKCGTPVFFNVQDLWPDNVEAVLGIHNKWIIGTIHKIVDKIYSRSDAILCASNGFVENIAARGVAREKLVFWPQFCEEPALEGAAKPACYDEDDFNVVFAGNIGDAQGLDLLLDGAKKLKDAPVKWFLLGDGRAKERLARRVRDESLEDQVIFLGSVSEQEANRYVHFADCAYLSFQDCKLFDLTIPAKLQTYLSCGVPVLAAAAGESAAIIRQADCGLVAERTPKAVAGAVEQLLRMRPDQRQKLGENGRAYFDAHFTMQKLVDRLEEEMEKYVDEGVAD